MRETPLSPSKKQQQFADCVSDTPWGRIRFKILLILSLCTPEITPEIPPQDQSTAQPARFLDARHASQNPLYFAARIHNHVAETPLMIHNQYRPSYPEGRLSCGQTHNTCPVEL